MRILLALFTFIKPIGVGKNRHYSTIYLVIILVLFVYTADDKAIELSFMAALFLFLFKAARWTLSDKAMRVLLYGIVVCSASLVMAHNYILPKAQSLLSEYIIGDAAWTYGNLNMKAQFYMNAFSPGERPFLSYLLGNGPGTCGSRAANMRAYDTLYKGPSSEAQAFKKLLPAIPAVVRGDMFLHCMIGVTRHMQPLGARFLAIRSPPGRRLCWKLV